MIPSEVRRAQARRFQTSLYQSGSVVALAAALQFAPNVAFAQNAQQGQAVALEEIVVTGSRVVTNGLQAPTPVTVVSAQSLQDSQPGNIGVSISQLPAFRGTSTNQGRGSTTTGGGGVSTPALRGLGASRTLVLMNGQRVVPQGTTGSVDLSLFPTAMIQRLDVVTGGASAAYGSDAVAGVVNIIMDTRYVGLKGQVEGGISSRGDHEYYKGELSWGSTFHGGDGHIVLSGEYSDEQGLKSYSQRDYAYESWAFIPNPNVSAATPASPTNPVSILKRDVRGSNATYGGVITSAGILKGIQFGPGGVPGPYNFGTFTSATAQVGGDGVNAQFDGNLLAPLAQKILYGHAEYDVSDAFTVFVEGNWSYNNATYDTIPNFQTGANAFPIFSGNPYIPASIQAIMTAKNIASFQLGRDSRDFGLMHFKNENTTKRFVGGFRGTFGDGWGYDSYLEWGQNKYHSGTENDANQKREYRAIDAVLDPASGKIVCKATLDNPTSTDPEIATCVPINPFGDGSPSAAALKYIIGTSDHHRDIRQTVAALTFRGTPFSTWAGPVSIAFGGEYRKEWADGYSDPITAGRVTNTDILANGTAYVLRALPAGLNGKLGGFDRTNNQPVIGSYFIKEGFAETLIPLAKDQSWATALDFNGAVRYADYNLSGGVTTWKAGLVYQPVDDIRIRGTQSRDIRAGNLTDLFTLANITNAQVVDPFRGNTQYNVVGIATSGNPNVTPEKADSTTAGVSYQPSWAPGLGMSLDYYRVNIKDAIGTLAIQRLVDLCFQGFQEQCAVITREPTVNGVPGLIIRAFPQSQNIAFANATGWDFEIGYNTPADNLISSLDGTLGLRLIGTYADKLTTQQRGAALQDTAPNAGRWRATLTATYDSEDLSMFIRERWISSGASNATLTERDLDINHVPARYYTDITARYKLGEEKNTEVFLTVNNLFDKRPPNFGNLFTGGTRTDGAGLYDFVLRNFVAGIRFAR